MKNRITMLLAGALLALGASPATAQTDGYLLACSAPSQLGRGCTLFPGAGDPATILANPAALAGAAQRVVSLSGAAFLPSMDYTNSVNPTTAGTDNLFPLPAAFFGAREPGRMSFGFGIQTLGGMGADYALDHALLGPDQEYHSKFGLMKGALVAAYRISPRLSLGASLGALYGQLEFATPYAVNPAQLAGLAGFAQDPDYAPLLAGFGEAVAYADMSGLSGFGMTGGASIEFRASGRLTFALAWTPPGTLTMGGGTAAMDMNTQFAQLYQGMVAAKGGSAATVDAQLAGFGINMANGMATRFGAEVDFGVPQTVSLAMSARPGRRLALGVDVGWIGWREAFRSMPVRLAGGSNANVNIMMNGSPTDGGFATEWPLRWEDAWTVRVGGEFLATEALALRAGALHGTNPVSSAGLFTIFPGIVEDAVTLGFGYRVGQTTINLAFAHTFKREQTASSPHLVASEYANSCSHLSENTLALGLDWRF